MLLPYLNPNIVEAGCDEAGRGCLAGAVYAAAVILPRNFRNEELNDSKQLTDRQRRKLRTVIEREAVAWAVGIVCPQEIDRINILNASILAMHRAVAALKVRPDHLLIDGNRFRRRRELPPVHIADPNNSRLATPQGLTYNRVSDNIANPNDSRLATPQSLPGDHVNVDDQLFSAYPDDLPYTTIVKGDGKFLAIAAASILAKTYRDDHMDLLHRQFPCYGWQRNKGYPTAEHRQAIREHGPSPYHRLTFNLTGIDPQLTLDF